MVIVYDQYFGLLLSVYMVVTSSERDFLFCYFITGSIIIRVIDAMRYVLLFADVWCLI